jgi:hypothetical protein
VLLATVDLVAAHRSGLLESFGRDTFDSAGARRVRSVCGFDPVEPLRALGVAAGRTGAGALDFVVVAIGPFDADRIVACAKKMIVAQGGTPRRAKMGSFSSVHDESRAQAGVVAVRHGGPVLLGGSAYVRRILDVARSRQNALVDSSRHRPLFAELGDGGVARVTWLPPPGWVERLDTDGSDSPLRFVEAVALRVDGGTEASVRALVVCKSPERCKPIAAFARRAGALFEAQAPWVRDLRIIEREDRLEAKWTMSPQAALGAFDELPAQPELGPLLEPTAEPSGRPLSDGGP